MSMVITLLGKVGMSLLLSLASEKAFTELFLWIAKKGVASTKTTWDDELLDIVEKYMEQKKSQSN